VLTTNNDHYCRTEDCSASIYYYQAFNVTVSTSGYYTFQSFSAMDTFGCIYNHNFVPYIPLNNLLACDNDGAGNQQFRLHIWLDNVTTYVLIVSTYLPDVTGIFSINPIGSALIEFSPISISGKSSIYSRVFL
jgi:hypothetical protein